MKKMALLTMVAAIVVALAGATVSGKQTVEHMPDEPAIAKLISL